MSVWEIISEINAEIDEAIEKRGKIGLWLLFMPNIVGAFIAAIITMSLSLPYTSFLILAALFFFIGGIIKSLLLDKQSVFVSIVKNFFITVLFAALGAVGFLIISII